MKLVLVLAVIVVIALVVAYVATRANARAKKWSSYINPLPNGKTEVLVKNEWDGRQIEVATINQGLNDLERNAELQIALDDADKLAKDLNKRK